MGGLAVSLYLTHAHYLNFTDISYQSFCAISTTINCDTVAQSPYAILFNVPIAVWGVLGYLLFIVLLVFYKPTRIPYTGTAFLGLLAIIFSFCSVILAIVSIFFIRSYCLMCIILYGINFGLFYLTWLVQRRFCAQSLLANLVQDINHSRQRYKQFLIIVLSGVSLAGAALFFYPHYWILHAIPTSRSIEYGITKDGSPWIGAQNPSITITEYADYLCFQCGKMHHHLRQLMNQYPNQIRLVHRHFPLDGKVNPLIKDDVHPNAGLLSFFAIMAQEQNLFWQVNDALFRDARSKGPINFRAIAKETGLDLSQLQGRLNDPTLHQKLAEDIRSGLRLHINSTPSYVIDGKVYSGTIPMEILESALIKSK